MKARCILDTYPNRVFEGRLEEIGSVARESGGRGWFASATKPGFPVRIALARTDPLMRPGTSSPSRDAAPILGTHLTSRRKVDEPFSGWPPLLPGARGTGVDGGSRNR